MAQSNAAETAIDGRTARRERGRIAVIDATFELIREGHLPPDIHQVAERAGVSPASIFRYFGSHDELQQQTVERFLARYSPLFEVPGLGVGDLDERIDTYVAARLKLFKTIGPIMAMARIRSMQEDRVAEAVTMMRSALAAQVDDHFEPELALVDPAERRATSLLIDTMASIEAYATLRRIHHVKPAAIAHAWALGISRVLGSPPLPHTAATTPPATA